MRRPGEAGDITYDDGAVAAAAVGDCNSGGSCFGGSLPLQNEVADIRGFNGHGVGSSVWPRRSLNPVMSLAMSCRCPCVRRPIRQQLVRPLSSQ